MFKFSLKSLVLLIYLISSQAQSSCFPCLFSEKSCCERHTDYTNGCQYSELLAERYTSEQVLAHSRRTHLLQVIDRVTGEKLVLKFFPSPPHRKRFFNFLFNTLRENPHPNIITLKDLVPVGEHSYCPIYEFGGQTIFNYVQKKGKLADNETRNIFRQMLSAVQHLYSLGVSHHDLTFENFVIQNERVKLIDFELAGPKASRCHKHKGTRFYLAPEVLLGKLYDTEKAEIYSLGIILYQMLTGYSPFGYQRNRGRLMEQGNILQPHLITNPDALDLINRMLRPKARCRPSLQEVIKHAFLI